jgi:hypothetical protein
MSPTIHSFASAIVNYYLLLLLVLPCQVVIHRGQKVQHPLSAAGVGSWRDPHAWFTWFGSRPPRPKLRIAIYRLSVPSLLSLVLPCRMGCMGCVMRRSSRQMWFLGTFNPSLKSH